METNDEAPGWDAIDEALAPFVGREPWGHWGTGTGLPDQDGVWGISAFDVSNHLLYVTYGLTELFTKVSDDLDVSGWGAELTMRVLRPSDGDPPDWPVRLLARLCELVFERATPFAPGGRMEIPDGGGEVPPALCWTVDPVLEPVDGPFGSFGFTATLGVSRELIAAMQAASTEEVLKSLRSQNPLLVVGGPGLRW